MTATSEVFAPVVSPAAATVPDTPAEMPRQLESLHSRRGDLMPPLLLAAIALAALPLVGSAPTWVARTPVRSTTHGTSTQHPSGRLSIRPSFRTLP